jgi:glycerol uptake facilitator-like aquaporin
MLLAMARKLAAEALGTCLLLSVVVGSGIMGQSLAGGNAGLALLANSIAIGVGLPVLILVFGPISGAHFNPVVTLAEAAQGRLPWSRVGPYLLAQVGGAFAGVLAAHAMFGEAPFSISPHARSGVGQLLSEGVAKFGLLLAILAVSRTRPAAAPLAVGLYIASAYWFTASTSFANPAVTLARAATATFAGIRPADVPGFVAAQIAGGAASVALFHWLFAPHPARERASGSEGGGVPRAGAGRLLPQPRRSRPGGPLCVASARASRDHSPSGAEARPQELPLALVLHRQGVPVPHFPRRRGAGVAPAGTWQSRARLDLDLLSRALAVLEAASDVGAFSAEGERGPKERALARCEILAQDSRGATLEFAGAGFGKHQVRHMVTAAVGVAAGALSLQELARMIARSMPRPRRAPAEGLWLHRVLYPSHLDPFPDLDALAGP